MRINLIGRTSRYFAAAASLAFLVSGGTALAQTNTRARATSPITVRWLGHATFEITSSGGTRLLIDPFITGNPSTPDSLKNLARYGGAWKPNAILVTHSHS